MLRVLPRTFLNDLCPMMQRPELKIRGPRDAPAVDMVITLCDQAAGEVCPIWPEHPVSAHWGLEDPSRLNGSMDTIQRAFSELVFELKHRITILASLPLATLDKMTLRDQLHQIHAKQNINPST
jgi:arsenate reductase (thioredoxin)